MLTRSPRSLEATMADAARASERVPPLSRLMAWHRDAEDPYGRYCREERAGQMRRTTVRRAA